MTYYLVRYHIHKALLLVFTLSSFFGGFPFCCSGNLLAGDIHKRADEASVIAKTNVAKIFVTQGSL